MTVEVEKSLEAQLNGYVGRGVLSAYVNEEGHLILTMTDGETVDAGAVAAKLDTGLTKSGYAADAKATGDRISGVQHTANEACRGADDAHSVATAAEEKALAAQVAAKNAEASASAGAQRADDARRDAEEAVAAAAAAQDTALAAEKKAEAAETKAEKAAETAETLLKESLPAYVEEEAQRVSAAVQSHQGLNTLSILVSSDFHHSRYLDGYKDTFARSLRHCGQGMDLVAKMVHLDAVVRLGDYTWDNGQTPEEAMTEMREVFAATHIPGLPEINTCGNHDGNTGGTAPLTPMEIYRTVGIRNHGAVSAPEQVLCDCYRDFEAQKLRLIGLNTGNYFPTTLQMTWLTEVLEAMEDGWQAVILTHCPLNWNNSGTAAQTLSPYAGKILCIIHGHTHNCIVSQLGDTGIKQIAIPAANYARTNEYAEPWSDPQTPAKKADTAEDTAFCVLTMDTERNTVYADYYGAGYSRAVDVSKAEKMPYTNVLHQAVSEWGGTELYGEDYNGDGVIDGYKTGTRLNSSVQVVNAGGMCLTGIIHIQPGDVVRIKNITLSGSQTAYMGTFDSSGSAGTTGISALGSPDAAGVYTWTNTVGYSAFRLSVGLIDGNSIITVNEEIL